MDVSVELHRKIPGVTATRLAAFATEAARAAGVRGAVGIRVTSDRELRRMNQHFRGKDRPTDVLSFLPENLPGYAGDIVISADIARRTARELGHPIAAEVKVLILHGLLHLAGLDHETDQGEMARREQALRRTLGLPVVLTERDRKARPRPRTARG